MMIAKLTVEDLNKLFKELGKSRYATYVNVSIDGPRINFSFEGQDGKLVTVTVYTADSKISPTITRTETL